MRTFAELYRRFPNQMGDLCLEECLHAQRPVYIVDDWRDMDVTCYYCARQSVYVFSHYDADPERWTSPMPVPMHRQGTCDNELCIFLHAQFCDRQYGRGRERAFRKEYGCLPYDYKQEHKHEACLASLLAFDANRKGKERDHKHAVAAG